ncbi:hypothetical protein F4821DRAFT_79020 [Hypoxylon rubiginosum]|uniref:Uncharacterized protein n=1 Tax=Hypoxylon rubiginosum TaxID=110542 RepID=A0ACC0DKM1_9PEZI|nr:hypothetical protein F4821DRAFT_79020 [Hypoxylon rubiginosum]
MRLSKLNARARSFISLGLGMRISVAFVVATRNASRAHKGFFSVFCSSCSLLCVSSHVRRRHRHTVAHTGEGRGALREGQIPNRPVMGRTAIYAMYDPSRTACLSLRDNPVGLGVIERRLAPHHQPCRLLEVGAQSKKMYCTMRSTYAPCTLRQPTPKSLLQVSPRLTTSFLRNGPPVARPARLRWGTLPGLRTRGGSSSTTSITELRQV